MFRVMIFAALTALGAVGGVAVTRADATARVVGGADAPANSWPAIVALVSNGKTPSLGQFCAGTLIDPSWVVTAAHCITDGAGAVVPAASLDAVAGLTNLATDTGQRRSVTSIMRHPGFVPATFVNDVALLHLQTPVVPGPTVATMQLVSPIRPDLWDGGSPAQIAGWGETLRPVTPFPSVLQQATVPIQSDATCSTAYGADFFSASMLCAGPLAGGIDTCQGDSGGPLTVFDNTTRELVGAVSWGVGCAQPNLPGVYTRLDAYRGFIFGSSGLNLVPNTVAAPGTPTGPSAAGGTQSATVSWSPPVVTGGRAIETFGVRVIQNGVSGSLVPVPGNLTQTTITGLNPGSSYTFTVLAANDVGISPPSPATVGVIPTPLPPLNTVAPAVSGSARRGSVLSATPGSWSLLGTTTIAWERCDATGASCQDVVGATSTSLQLTTSEVGWRLRVRVDAQNSGGTTTARSGLTAVTTAPAPVVVSAPTISGRARVGRALDATGGVWSEPASLQLVWQSCDPSGSACADIAGAVGATFTPVQDLVGRRLRVRVAGSNGGGVGEAFSQATPSVRAVFAIAVVRARRVAQSMTGLITITIRVHVEPGARLAIQLRDTRGKARRLQGRMSRINGKTPLTSGATMLTALAPSSGVMDVSVVVGGRARGVRRSGTIVLTASASGGERAVTATTFRARL